MDYDDIPCFYDEHGNRQRITKITLPAYPTFGKLINWIDQAVAATTDASGRGDDSCVEWLNGIIEKDNTFLGLKDVPKKWWWVDRRIAEAMKSMMSTAVQKKNQHAMSLQKAAGS